MSDYMNLRENLKKKNGWTEKELKDLVKLAQAWHNPLNYDNGDAIRDKNGWTDLFTDSLNKAGFGKRYYFRFHEYDMTDPDVVVNAFKNCSNYEKYKKVWKESAPEEISNPGLYLIAITEMSVRGFRYEKHVLDALEAAGKTVKSSSFIDDYSHGIDAWVDGKPIQIKSPATQRGMARATN